VRTQCLGECFVLSQSGYDRIHPTALNRGCPLPPPHNTKPDNKQSHILVLPFVPRELDEMEPKLHDSYRSLEEDRLRRYYSCPMSQRFIRYRPQLKPLAAIYPEILCPQQRQCRSAGSSLYRARCGYLRQQSPMNIPCCLAMRAMLPPHLGIRYEILFLNTFNRD
jgi:hypothetical protein